MSSVLGVEVAEVTASEAEAPVDSDASEPEGAEAAPADGASD